MNTKMKGALSRFSSLLLFSLLIFSSLDGYAESDQSPQRQKVGLGGGSGNGGGSSTVLPDLSTGVMSYSVSIEAPVGRKGMDPGLALTYKSNNGNSWLGHGWEIEVGAIERSMKDGVNYSGGDYVLRFQGGTLELVNISGIEYRAKIEGAFVRVVKTPKSATDPTPLYWEVYDKAGVHYTYGKTAYGTGAPLPRPGLSFGSNVRSLL